MSRFTRQSFLGVGSEALLAKTIVGIVGLGGGGSHVAQQLAHLGVGRYVVVDPKKIDKTNLNRLVGATAQDVALGTPKVDIASRTIKGIHPEAAVDKYQSDWQEAIEALKGCDVIIGGLDSVRAKAELDAFARRFLIPYIDMGMDVFPTEAGEFLIAGQVALSSPGAPCLRCFGIVTEAGLVAEARNYGAAGGQPQVVWPNGVLASTAVGLLIQLVTPWHRSSAGSAFLRYDGNRNTMTVAERFEHVLARGCTHFPPKERGDPTFDIRQVFAETEKPPLTKATHEKIGWWKCAIRWVRNRVSRQTGR